MQSLNRVLGLLVFVLSAVLLPAQVADEPIYAPVKFKVTAGVTSYLSGGGRDRTPTLFYNNGTVTATLNGASASDSGRKPTLNTPIQTSFLEVGKPYSLVISTGATSTKTVYITPSPGYLFTVDGTAKNSFSFSGGTGVYTVRIIPAESQVPRPAGTASSITGGQIKWNVAVGALLNGESAGALSIVGAAIDDWSPFFTPTTLYYDSLANDDEVRVHRESGNIRQVSTKEAFVDVVTLNTTSYEIRFYSPASATGTTYPKPLTGRPFVTYRISQDSLTKLRLTKETRTVLSPTDTTAPIARSETTTIERTGTSPAFTWTVADWTLTGQTALSREVRTWTGNASGGHDETIQILDSTNTVAAQSFRSHTKYFWGDTPTQATIGTTAAVTTNTVYNTDPANPSSYGFTRSVQSTGGAWSALDYFPTTDDLKLGTVSTTYGPYLNSPGSISMTPGSGVVTSMTYVADPFGMLRRLATSESRINGILVAKTAIAYAQSVANGMYVVSATRQDQSNSAGSTLTSTTLTYQEDTGDAFFRNQAHAIIKPDRSAQSFIRQRGTWDGTTFTPAATGALAPASRHGTISGVADNTAGTQLISTYGDYALQPLYLVPNKSTLDFVIRDSLARTARTESYVWDGAGWNLISWTNFTYNNNNQLRLRVTSTGDTYEADYVGELKQWERDGTGIKATYGYDNASRVITVTKEGVAPQVDLVSASSYDAANRVLTQSSYAATAPTGEKITTSRTYDLAGRPVTEIAPGTGATTFSYDPVNRSQTVTTPDLATRTQTTYLDGQPYSTTGTGTVAQYITYGVEIDGRRYSQINLATANSARWSKTWTDWLGRSDRSERPGFTGQANFVEQNTYHATTGQLIKTDRTGTASTLYTYNALGQPVLSGLDINANGTLDLASADRITGQDKWFAYEGKAWWLATRSYTYPTLNSATEITLASTRERLTEFSGNLRSEARSTDAEGNTAVVTVSVDRTARTVTKSTQAPGLSSAQVETTVNGLGTSATTPDGITVTTGYDLLQRPVTSTNIRAGVTRTSTTAYEVNTARASTVKDPTNTVIATYGYDTMGRKTSVKNVDNKYTRTAYTPRGEVLAQWGEATSPVSFGYSDFGERTSLTTYRTDTGWTGTTWPATPAAGDTTIYTFDGPSGLLIKKTDAASRYVEYDYNPRGQVLNRYWSRTCTEPSGTIARVKATYAYDAKTAEPTGITYNDGTPAVSTTYTRSAQVSTVSDVTGTRSFTYDPASPWRLSTDTLPAFYQSNVFTRLYETTTDTTLGTVKGRARGFQLGTSANSASLLQQTYAWNALGRVASVTAGTNNNTTSQVFAYNYLAGSRLIESLAATGTAFTTTRSYETARDLLTSIKGQYSTATKSQFDYTFDAFGRRATAAQSGDAFNDYGAATFQRFNYNDRGELTAATGYLGSEAPANKLPGRQFEFGYDAAGNRTSGNHTGDPTKADTFVPNQLNQLTSRQNKALSVSGTAAADATVVVDDKATVRKGGFWQLELLQPENIGALARSFAIIAAKPGAGTGGADLAQIDRRWLFQPGYTETLAYDADGNLTSDAKWTYSWDAENRLTAMEAKPWTAPAGAPARQRLEFRYDSTGRRVQKRALTEVVAAPGTWNLTSETRFLYDGWNLIAEFEATSSQLPALSLKRSFAWGLDLTGSFTAAGGIGGLLQITDASTGTRYLPTYDGNGNVATLVNATTGVLGASYEYNAFGEPLRTTGTYAKANPIRFSTKYTDNETGLIYYGFRYYDAHNGRFINRDPIEERGGMNLYGFCGNDGVNQWDYLGNSWLSRSFKAVRRITHQITRTFLTIPALRSMDRRLERWEDNHQQEIKIAAAIVASIVTYGAASAYMFTAATATSASSGVLAASVTAGTMSATTAGVIAGVVGGAAAGAVGGTIMTGTVRGTLQGAVAGAITGGVDSYFGGSWSAARLISNGVAGGAGSEIMGGDFKTGFAFAFAASAARAFYETTVQYKIDPKPGGPAVQKSDLTPPFAGANNIGTQGGSVANPTFFAEGGTLSEFLNHIPGVNAVSGLHDFFQITLGTGWTRNVFNVPGMPVAAAVTYAGMLSGLPTTYVSLPRNGETESVIAQSPSFL